MVRSTLCPAVHILGSQNMYGRAEGIADHYWPWAVFFFGSKLVQIQYKIYSQDKKMGVTHEKMGF